MCEGGGTAHDQFSIKRETTQAHLEENDVYLRVLHPIHQDGNQSVRARKKKKYTKTHDKLINKVAHCVKMNTLI